jgi:hypothetical protein
MNVLAFRNISSTAGHGKSVIPLYRFWSKWGCCWIHVQPSHVTEYGSLFLLFGHGNSTKQATCWSVHDWTASMATGGRQASPPETWRFTCDCTTSINSLSFNICRLQPVWRVNIIHSARVNKFCGLSPRENYTDLATNACRRSYCQFLRLEGATWSAWRFPTAVCSAF